MLKKLRNKKTAKKIWIILAAIIVPAFVFWGSGSLIRSKEETSYAGTIFGKKISLLEYKEALQATRNQAIIQLGDRFSELAKYLNLEKQAWERLMVLAEAEKRKISASDEEVVKAIEGYPFFQSREGQFDPVTYARILRYVFYTQPRVFEEETRQTLMLAKLFKEVTKGVSLTEDQVREGFRRENEKLSAYYITGITEEFKNQVTPADADLEKFFQEHSFEFKRPLSFNLEYVFSPSEEAIQEVSRRLSQREKFEKVARESGLLIKETGLFAETDPVPGIGWSREVAKQIMKLAPNGYSQPLLVDKNYYILRLKEKKEPYVPELEEVREKAKEAFTFYKSQELIQEKMNECLRELKTAHQENPKSINFEKLAKEKGLKFGATDEFNYASYIEGVGGSDVFWLVAQKLKEDEFSQVITLPSGFYIIKLKSRTAMDEEKFQKEKEEFSQKLLLEKQHENFGQFIEELYRKAQQY